GEGRPQQGSDHDDGTRGDRQATDGLTRGRVCEFKRIGSLETAKALDLDVPSTAPAGRFLLRRVRTRLAQSGHTEMSAICPLSVAKRTLPTHRHPIAVYEYARARASQPLG